MHDPEEKQLKAEIDAIMDNVESIMLRVETMMPTEAEEIKPKKDR